MEEAEDKPQSQSHVLRDLIPLPSPHPIRFSKPYRAMTLTSQGPSNHRSATLEEERPRRVQGLFVPQSVTNECSLPSTWHWPGLVQLPASIAEDQKVVCVPARAGRQRPMNISDGHTQAKSYRSARSHRQMGFQPHSWALTSTLKQAVASPSSSGFPHRACWFDSKPVNQRPRRERQLFFICRCHASHSEAPLSLPGVAGKTQRPELSEEHRRKKKYQP